MVLSDWETIGVSQRTSSAARCNMKDGQSHGIALQHRKGDLGTQACDLYDDQTSEGYAVTEGSRRDRHKNLSTSQVPHQSRAERSALFRQHGHRRRDNVVILSRPPSKRTQTSPLAKRASRSIPTFFTPSSCPWTAAQHNVAFSTSARRDRDSAMVSTSTSASVARGDAESGQKTTQRISVGPVKSRNAYRVEDAEIEESSGKEVNPTVRVVASCNGVT